MSRIRTGHTPDAWLQEEPQEHVRRYTPTAFGAATGPAMIPALRPGGNFMPGREAWKLPALRVNPAIAAQLDPQPKPRCGVVMRVVGEPCARLPGHCGGHGGGHRSAGALEADNIRRRKWRKAS